MAKKKPETPAASQNETPSEASKKDPIASVDDLKSAYPELMKQFAEAYFKAELVAKEEAEALQAYEESQEAERIAMEKREARREAFFDTPYGALFLRLSDEVIEALELLDASGFKIFMEAKLEDVREITGRRHRTFRNEGRYDLVAALKKAG